MTVLEVNGLKKYYGKTKAVDGISFSLESGQVTGLLGPNGAGKTTTLKCITGLLRKTEGTITIEGMDHRDDEARAKLCYIPEVPDIYEGLTVWDHFKFIALAYGLENWEERANDLMERFDLMEKRNELGMHLSKGMKQKLAIICAFIHDARTILFDEPLIGIDPKGARELKDMIIEAKENGCSVLISTHMLDTAERLCDRIIILRSGQKIAEGTLAELQERARLTQDATLEDMFLTLTAEGSASESTGLPGL